MTKQVSRFAANADSRGNAIDKGGVRITHYVDNRLTEETRLYRLDDSVQVTVKDVVSGSTTTRIAAANELEEV